MKWEGRGKGGTLAPFSARPTLPRSLHERGTARSLERSRIPAKSTIQIDEGMSRYSVGDTIKVILPLLTRKNATIIRIAS